MVCIHKITGNVHSDIYPHGPKELEAPLLLHKQARGSSAIRGSIMRDITKKRTEQTVNYGLGKRKNTIG